MFEKLGQIASLLKNFPKMQEEMAKFQQNVGQITAEGDAGAGWVKVKVNGRREVLSCSISEDAFKGGDRELVEDLVKAAVNLAIQKVNQQVSEAYARMAASLGMPAAGGFPLPGMM